MKGLNFVTNDKGERIALMINLKNKSYIGKDYIEYLEELEDIIDIELRKNEESIPMEEVGKLLDKERKPNSKTNV
jgi:hypothetical protein